MSTVKTTFSVIGVVLLAIALLSLIGFVASGANVETYKFWAPKQAAAERQVFEQSPSYVEGKRSYIAQLQLEYATADPAHKQALRTMILNEASSVDITKLTEEQQYFIHQLEEEDQ